MGFPEKPTGLPSGVDPAQQAPAPEGTPQGAPPQQPVATDLKAELEAQRRQWELESQRNISRLQSTLMSQQTQQQRQFEAERAEWEQRLTEAQLGHLEGEERTKFELEMLRQRNSAYEQQLVETRAQAEAVQNMNAYASWFMSLGVPYERLDWSSPEMLAQSGAMTLVDIQQRQKQELEELRAKASAPAAPVTPQAPVMRGAVPTPVVTQPGSAPTAGATFEDIRKSLSTQLGHELSAEDVFKYADRSPQVRAKLAELAQGMAEQRAAARGG